MYLFSVSRRDRKHGFFSQLIFCIALLVMGATEAKAVSYTGFVSGNTYELTPWEGTSIVVLTQSNTLDVSTMRNIVENLDAAWGVYEDLTGRSPTPSAATTLNGLSTIAEVPDGETCGAGCAFLGATGIEIMSTYWNILYNGVMSANEYDHVLFSELGRNFWFYSDQLGAIEPFVHSFAIANRFVSMNEIDVAGGPFGNFTFDEFKRLATEELFAAYLADPSLDWRNTLAANSGVPGQVFSGAADLGGAILHRIYEDHGYAGYRAFWRELNDLPVATTSEDAMVNFIYAAYLGTGQDYRPLLKADDLPLSPTQEKWTQWQVEDGGNGHYYQVVTVPGGISWPDANFAALRVNRYSHLATITTQEENDFITELLQSGYGWIGGIQTAGAVNPDDGWRWVTDEAFAFTNWWSPWEPNGLPGEEIFLELTTSGKWNDCCGSLIETTRPLYIVESIVPQDPLLITFEELVPGQYPELTSMDYQFSPVWNTNVVIRDDGNKALQPRWNDWLDMRREDGTDFHLVSFDYRPQWPAASGEIQIYGYQVNGNVLIDSFTYDGSTVPTTKILNWSGLESIEFRMEKTLLFDNFSVIP